MKLIDVSGFGHSGKTAVTDLLREVEGVHAHHSSFEFSLLRLPDGLLDFKRNIIDNWTLIKADFAVKRFLNLCSSLSGTYNEQLSINLEELTNEFIDSIVVDELETEWYDSLYSSKNNSTQNRLRSILKKTGLLSSIRILRRNINSNSKSSKDKVYLIDQSKLLANSKIYLEKVLNSNNNKVVVTNNAFEPFNPSENNMFFDNSYSIIVDRDPRDIYLSAINQKGLFIPEFEKNNPVFSLKYIEEQKKDFLGTSNIDTFIWRQKQLRENCKQEKECDRIIRLKYEDIVCNYENTKDYLFNKLNLDSKLQKEKFKYFNPQNSKKNVGLWKHKRTIPEIIKIEKELNKYIID